MGLPQEISEEKKPVKYGELVILGYNGFLPPVDRGRRRSKFVLYKRSQPNGVKKSKHYVVKTPHSSQSHEMSPVGVSGASEVVEGLGWISPYIPRQSDLSCGRSFQLEVPCGLLNPATLTNEKTEKKEKSKCKAILDSKQHSISFTLSRNEAVIVEYMPDEETDMFQIGRSSDPPIDFVIMDTIPGEKRGEERVNQSTISRFACRILADRSNPKVCRIYAAGFDSSRNIFLGEKATKWQDKREIDGLTTNGVLIMHPVGNFVDGDSKPGVWREVSVGGGVFSTRESRSAQEKGSVIASESNILQDGTLIDLCGATLLWRSAEGLAKSPTRDYIEALVDKLNAAKPLCPVGLNTLVIPRKGTVDSCNEMEQPYVYLNCGHVQGRHSWGQDKDSDARRCSLCFKVGPVVKVTMGVEPAFYVGIKSSNFYAFSPCGHMTTEKTAKFWSQTAIPHGTNGFDAVCPFCATPLTGYPGYVRLIFQDNVD